MRGNYTFLRDLWSSREDKVIIDVNVNKLHQPWRSFAAVYQTSVLEWELNNQKQKQVSIRSKLDLTSQRLLQLLKEKRLKTSAKAAKTAKKKQPTKTSKAKGLTVLSEVALTEVEQMKLAIKRSLIESHSSHASGSAIDKGTGSKPGVPGVPTYGSDEEQISWKGLSVLSCLSIVILPRVVKSRDEIF
ncbi:hypothetical protein Tco_0409381 [Tanacetum coccineum]